MCLSNTRRSGAQRGVPRLTSARGFLGRPLHFLPGVFPQTSVVIPNRAEGLVRNLLSASLLRLKPASTAPERPPQPDATIELQLLLSGAKRRTPRARFARSH